MIVDSSYSKFKYILYYPDGGDNLPADRGAPRQRGDREQRTPIRKGDEPHGERLQEIKLEASEQRFREDMELWC